jgi:hypothetical protein
VRTQNDFILLLLFYFQAKVIDECYLVLVHTPLFTFVRPLVLLIFTNLTCFVCFVLIRSLHHKLTEGANGHEES